MSKINLKEIYELEKDRLGKLFDEQVEEIKEYLVNTLAYSLSEPETKNFVQLISEYRDAHIAQELLVETLERQRDSINTNSNLLSNLVDTKTVHETLTYVLKELRAVDEDGHLKERE